MMRWFASTALVAGSLLVAGAASASGDYPAIVKSHLSLMSTPACTLCHDGSPGVGTATTPFGTTAQGQGLKLGNTALLETTLDKMKTAKSDSDKDGETDIDELIAGTDPNTAGGVVNPELTYGCVATLAPGRPSPSSGVAFGLALVAAAAWARRRRSDAR
jgi:hypothetical protein